MMNLDEDSVGNLLDAVRILGPQLTHIDHEMRQEGLLFLERKILRTPLAEMHPGEVTSLVEFLVGKLGDHYSLCGPALRCLRYLGTSEHLTFDDAVVICRAIFSEIQNQSMNQLERQTVYSIFGNMLSRYCDELAVQMSHDFVFGFIQAIEGEKDPRNLIIVFRLAEIVIKRFNIDRFTEDLFEVVSCYYPVVFVPPPNDTRGITRDQLVRLNRACLVASASFAPFLLPLLLEKFQEGDRETRLEAFEILAEAAPSYSLRDLKMYELSLIDCLQKELTKDMSSEMEQAVNQCGFNLSLAFGSHRMDNSDGDSSPLEQFIDNVFKAASEALAGSQGSDCGPSGRFLLTIGGSSLAALERIALRTVPFLLDLQKNEHFLCLFFDLARSMIWRGHLPYVAKFRTASNLGDEPFPSVNFLLRLALLYDFFSDDRVRSVMRKAMEWLSQEANETCRSDTIKLLAEVACFSPSRDDAMEVCEETTSREELFMEWKKSLIDETTPSDRRQIALQILQACAKFSTAKCMHLVRWLLSSSDSCDNSLILPPLSAIISDAEDEDRVPAIAKELVTFITSLAPQKWKEMAEGLKTCVVHLARVGSPEIQTSLLKVCHERLTINEDLHSPSIDLFSSLVCSLTSEVAGRSCPVSLMETLFGLSERQETAAHAYASLLNKTASAEDVLGTFLRHRQSLDWSSVPAGLHLWFVLCTRALLARNHPKSADLLRELLETLEASRLELATWTAERSGLLVQPLPETFHRSVQFSLALHKTFVLLYQRLGPKCSAMADERRDLNIGALVLTLQHLPQQVLLQHLDDILAVLVRALLLSQPPGAAAAALNCLQNLCELPAVSSTIAKHADDFLPALLATLKENDASMDGRIGAARLLRACLPCLSPVTLRSHRANVLRQLAGAADDRKRLVRQEAAAARNLWLISVGTEAGAK